MAAFLYEATDRSGHPHAGRIQAQTLAEARYRLELQGCSNIRFHTDPQIEAHLSAVGVAVAEGVTPAEEVRARRMQPGWLPELRGAYANGWWIWLPLVAWAAWSIYSGPPFDFVDGLAFALAAAGLLFPLRAAAPSLLYTKLLEADSWARHDDVLRLSKRMLALRRWITIDAALVDVEFRRAAACARKGALPAALESVRHLERELPRLTYLGRVVSIHGAAGDWQTAAACQAEAVELAHRGTNEIIDLATTLIWRLRRVDEAAALLEEVRDQEKSIIAAAYHSYASGLVALERGKPAATVVHLTECIESLTAAGTSPLLGFMVDYSLAFLAIAQATLGDKPLATRLLDRALPRLRAFGDEALIERAAGAMGSVLR